MDRREKRALFLGLGRTLTSRLSGWIRPSPGTRGFLRAGAVVAVLVGLFHVARSHLPLWAADTTRPPRLCAVPVEVSGRVVCWEDAGVERVLEPRCRLAARRLRIRAGSRLVCGPAGLVVGRMSAGLQELFGLPVDVNRAGLEDLESLPGVGPALAARILEVRRRIGCFESLESLTLVPGVGRKLVARIRSRARAGPCRP